MSNDLALVEKTIAILEQVNWAAYSNHQAADYLAYVQGQHADEISLMDGLLNEFLEQVLGFTLHQDLLPQITSKPTGKRPDYVPDDVHLHPFIFDAKGTDTTDLGQHYDQIARYMRAKGLRYGILSNMRDLAVYTLQSAQPEVDFSFSFRQLYQDHQQGPAAVLQARNTKHFLDFVHRFRRRELDQAGKVQSIIDARHGPQAAQLDLDELVRRLHNTVTVFHDDVRLQRDVPPQIYHYNYERRERIALEIDAIAHEIDSGAPERKIKAATLKTLLDADAGTTDGRATDRYFYRVAYFAMTRILLARVWEDIGFIDQTLYDGGFERWYEYYNAEIRRILSQAFHFANERYTWLYGTENNYTWYTPSETVLVDVLYDFSRFDFRALNADVLGAVYEAYLDETDRKNKGQYYTPRSVVQFLWDRVGFDAPDRIFSFAGGERKPRVVADFCTGSGGFLVEAARRIRETALGPNFDPSNPASLENVSLDDLVLAMNAIIEGLRGAEINAFAYYLTEVNLLIQLTPIIAAIQEKAPHAPYFGHDFALAVLHQDALKLHNRLQPTLNDNDHNHVPEFARTDEVYEQDRRYDIVNFSGFKRAVYAWLKDERAADYICSNPPYVGEKGHKELFRYYRNNFDYWDEHYQGKMDYLYWFIILGLSKLRDGGRLGFITTSYWPTADGAKTLRRYILDHAKIVEMVDFGDTRIFADAPGQHNMVFVLERCEDEEER
ncbi:MAG: N-6 DNA methylase, partial [Chloroflexota bacterium]|nr:N-6 DNA methylase [Chloroflexota bacterium]